jgi:DNA-binding NarL/FixJ family response regulator
LQQPGEEQILRVVLADDHDVVRNGLRLLLESNFPFHVLEVGTATDAVSWASDPSVALVFLDARLDFVFFSLNPDLRATAIARHES